MTPELDQSWLNANVRMAYIARLRPAAQVGLRGTALVPARGDKWYMDPEEERQYGSPFHVKWSGSFPITYGPSWSDDTFMNQNNMYPRMPMYHRQIKNPNLKYDLGIGMRKNFGETYHIMEVLGNLVIHSFDLFIIRS